MNFETKRRMPVEEDWFDRNTPAILYGLMQSEAEYDQEVKKLLYPKKKLKAAMSDLKKYLGIKAKRNESFNLKVKKLLEAGYLSEDNDSYYFPYKEENKYLLMPKSVLRDLCRRTNDYALKIYVYLAFRSNAIKNYKFTICELALMMGYSTNGGTSREGILKALTTLKALKYLDYDKKVVKIDNVLTTNLYVKDISLKIPTELIKEEKDLRKIHKGEDVETAVAAKNKNLFEF